MVNAFSKVKNSIPELFSASLALRMKRQFDKRAIIRELNDSNAV